jgi:hypothetical protein
MRRITEAAARQNFVKALERLYHFDLSPLKVLTESFLPRWRGAMYPTSRQGRYVSADERKQRDQQGRRVLEDWAKACRLVSVDSYGEESPADWLVDYARIFCEQYVAPRSESMDTTSEWHPPLFESEPTPSKARMSPPGGWYPEPSPGETWIQYRRRISKGLKKHWESCQIESKTRGAHARVGNTNKTAENEKKYEWLTLYQCCKWSLKRIAARSGRVASEKDTVVEQTTWQGIQFTAERVGLKVTYRRNALKRSTL